MRQVMCQTKIICDIGNAHFGWLMWKAISKIVFSNSVKVLMFVILKESIQYMSIDTTFGFINIRKDNSVSIAPSRNAFQAKADRGLFCKRHL